MFICVELIVVTPPRLIENNSEITHMTNQTQPARKYIAYRIRNIKPTVCGDGDGYIEMEMEMGMEMEMEMRMEMEIEMDIEVVMWI